MVEIVWEFRVASEKKAEFERHYGPEGTWVQLFRRSPEFIGTELLRDREAPERYLTIDRWKSVASYDAFRDEFAEEYKRTDAEMESLTQSETKLGVFEAM